MAGHCEPHLARHCEPKAKQSHQIQLGRGDCFVAAAPRNDRCTAPQIQLGRGDCFVAAAPRNDRCTAPQIQLGRGDCFVAAAPRNDRCASPQIQLGRGDCFVASAPRNDRCASPQTQLGWGDCFVATAPRNDRPSRPRNDSRNDGLFGCGLRPAHHADFLQGPPPGVDLIEIIAESFMDWSDGTSLQVRRELHTIRGSLPIVIHGVSLNIGCPRGVDPGHLSRLKHLIDEIDPLWVSDHLCWTGLPGQHAHDLLPLPFTKEALHTVCRNVDHVQTALGRPLVLENVSTYLRFEQDSFSEWDFLNEVIQRTGCQLLLDVNNVYVNSRNHGFDPVDFLKSINSSSIQQIHLSGHQDRGHLVLDTHDGPTTAAVWELYAWVCRHKGIYPTVIEWDAKIPPLGELLTEVHQARQTAGEAATLAALR